MRVRKEYLFFKKMNNDDDDDDVVRELNLFVSTTTHTATNESSLSPSKAAAATERGGGGGTTTTTTTKTMQHISTTTEEEENNNTNKINKINRIDVNTIPTSDEEVKQCLRALKEPIILFAEDKFDRRMRLRRIMMSARKKIDNDDDDDDDNNNKRMANDDDDFENTKITQKQKKETFYTEGSVYLTRSRIHLAKFSLQRANERRRRRTTTTIDEGETRDDDDDDQTYSLKRREEFLERRRKETEEVTKSLITPISSVIGDSRPLSAVTSFLFQDERGGGRLTKTSTSNNSGSLLGVILSASFTGAVKLWNVSNESKGGVLRKKAFNSSDEEKTNSLVAKNKNDDDDDDDDRKDYDGDNINCVPIYTIKASEERITGLCFSPFATAATAESFSSTTTSDLPAFASAAMNGICTVWNFAGKRASTLSGHVGRLAKVKFHPSGSYIATAGYDKTIRLWDVNTSQEIFCQEAHSRAAYDCAFNKDGSLLFTTGLDAYARMWDLRSGRCLWTMKGHSKGVTSVSVDCTNSLCVTGGEDNLVKVWDLRKQKNAYTIPAHSGLVTSVSFEPNRGCWFSTSSFDGTIKLWSALDFSLLSRLDGHEGKVMDCSLGGNNGNNFSGLRSTSESSKSRKFPSTLVVSAGYDRTLKIWKS